MVASWMRSLGDRASTGAARRAAAADEAKNSLLLTLIAFRLKGESHPELDVPRSVGDVADFRDRRRHTDVGCRNIKIGMVHDVEELRSKFEPSAFSDVPNFVNGLVPV